jgi:excisionase family DNA binding protein
MPQHKDSEAAGTSDIPQHALLTSDEVCNVLRISPRTLKRWRSARILTHVRRGRAFLFPRAAVEKYITSRTVIGRAA